MRLVTQKTGFSKDGIFRRWVFGKPGDEKIRYKKIVLGKSGLVKSDIREIPLRSRCLLVSEGSRIGSKSHPAVNFSLWEGGDVGRGDDGGGLRASELFGRSQIINISQGFVDVSARSQA